MGDTERPRAVSGITLDYMAIDATVHHRGIVLVMCLTKTLEISSQKHIKCHMDLFFKVNLYFGFMVE